MYHVSTQGVDERMINVHYYYYYYYLNERLIILTQTHSMQIFGEIPFIKPQKDT